MSASQHQRRAGPESDGMRLDQFLAGEVEISRSMLRKIIDIGGVHVAGRRIRRCAHQVRSGDVVEIFLDGLPLEPFFLTDANILYRDRFLLAVNKPAGIEMQPTPARYRGTLYEALLTFLRDPFRPLDQPAVGMVQRLDRDTSGAVIFSIHPRTHRPLTEAIAGREVSKIYLALVAGSLEKGEGEIRSRLARSRDGNRVKSVDKGGKEAVTRYRTLEVFGSAALLQVELVTGRSHQIRAHFSEAGHPLLGDRRYGGPALADGIVLPRQMLHSWRLGLRHPLDGSRLEIEAPLPDDFTNCIAVLRRSAATP